MANVSQISHKDVVGQGWKMPGSAPLLPCPTGKLGDARNAARSYLIVLNRPERQPKGGH